MLFSEGFHLYTLYIFQKHLILEIYPLYTINFVQQIWSLAENKAVNELF